MPPGGSAIVFMDVSVVPGHALPPTLAPRITVTRQGVGPDGKPIPLPKEIPVPATVTFTGAGTRLSAPPPLWSSRRCAGPGGSPRTGVATPSPRTGARSWPSTASFACRSGLPSTGSSSIQVAHVYTGDPKQLSSWRYYGTPVHSVAAGKVVNLYDAADEQVPGAPVQGLSTESIGGNMLVVDIGGGNYAFYAHLQRGSLKVKLGDRVIAGQVIGLLGNTGNSTAPHLHFHVMDGPSPLDANGLPYVFTHFTGRGVVADADADGGWGASKNRRRTARRTAHRRAATE